MLKFLRCSWLMMLLAVASVQANAQATDARLDEVQRRGAQVMPFDLEQTTHVFKKTKQGGVQEVVAKKSSNTEQIELIRAHLSKISRQFATGDFSDPAKIHGEEMPGLAQLRNAKPGQIKIDYEELAEGGRIRYTTNDPALIKAIHQWFDAQLRDHARHAVATHPHDPAHAH
jgi:hypothetical protein